MPRSKANCQAMSRTQRGEADWKSMIGAPHATDDKADLVRRFQQSADVLLTVCADEQLDAAYSEVQSVVSVGRGIGLWGDMVITLRNGDKIELRSLPECAVLPHARIGMVCERSKL